MDQKEWKAAAQYNGFEEIMAIPVAGGWRLVGWFENRASVPLPTKRGEPRVFASLDTIARFLKPIRVGQFNVYQVADNDLFA